MKQDEIEELFSKIAKLKVAVIGDVMLDTYWWGKVDRISPEAPVPIVVLSSREKRIGGAGNVALNARQLGAKVAVISVLGDDDEGRELKEKLQENEIDTRYILTSRERVTTNKIRIISRNQQMMRLDAEHTSDISKEEEEKLQNLVEKYIHSEKPDVLILEDYNKGIFTENLISKTLEYCQKANVLTAVDPKKKNFFAYHKADLFKPNLSEAITSLNLIPQPLSEAWLGEIHELLKERLDHKFSLITLSEKGIFYQGEKQKNWIPAFKREISDVSGAGDTVIAVAALVYAATLNIDLTARISNLAGGLVCEVVGTAAVNKEKLMSEAAKLTGMEDKA